MRPPLMFAPRLARILHHPTLAAVLGGVLIVAGVAGIVTSGMPIGWSILIIVVGTINALRGLIPASKPTDEARTAGESAPGNLR